LQRLPRHAETLPSMHPHDREFGMIASTTSPSGASTAAQTTAPAWRRGGDEVERRGRAHGLDHAPGHHGRHGRAEGHDDRLRMTLSLKVAQTFEAVLGNAAGSPTDSSASTEAANGSPTVEASLKLRITDQGIRLKLKLDVEGGVSAADFGSLMDSFVGTLQAALQTLAGRGGATTPAPAMPVVPADAAESPTAPTVPTASPPVATADTAAPAITPVVIPPTAAAPSTTNVASSFSVKLRMTYQEPVQALSPLVQQLASPDVVAQVPEVTPMLDDLSQQFAPLNQALAQAGAQAPSLGAFLQALASRLAAPAAQAGADDASTTRYALSLQARMHGGLVDTLA
jgi:hypothetical protein